MEKGKIAVPNTMMFIVYMFRKENNCYDTTS